MNQDRDLAPAQRAARLALAGGLALALAACQEGQSLDDARAYHPIPQATLDLMAREGTTASAPMLIRAYKKEAELQVWKLASNGRYAFLKTFPMCRWSGQLGPKTREGDRQVPEGFYTITPGQMNPNSHYYLSFNVGYPNAYDKAHDDTGSDIMVHGICSSAGCFSMTNEQIDEIYALAREAFAGGQREIQMESFPFHMTADNLAKFRLDPNMPFWTELKKGSDYFEVSGQEPQVGVCGKRYVFDKVPAYGGRLQPAEPCPVLKDENPVLASAVEAKEHKDDMAVAALVEQGVQAVRLVYQDGGQNPAFADRVADVSRPDALAVGPIAIPVGPAPKASAIKLASAASPRGAKIVKAKSLASKRASLVAEAPAAPMPVSPPVQAPPTVAQAAPAGQPPFFRRWFSLVSDKLAGAPAPVAQASAQPRNLDAAPSP